MSVYESILIFIVVSLIADNVQGHAGHDGKTAICTVSASSGTTGAAQQPISGEIKLTQHDATSNLTISVSLTGFNTTDANTIHAFHIHETADIGNACSNMGGHFDPHGVAHGLAGATPRHVGDFGNIVEDSAGMVEIQITDDQASLYNDTRGNYVADLGFVIHEENDKGTQPTGGAGGRLACCLLEIVTSASPSSFHPFTALLTFVCSYLFSWLL